MKKTIFLLLGTAILTLTVFITDYQNNNRFHQATLYTVFTKNYREQMRFSAPIKRQGERYLMSGAVRKIENITTGAEATVLLGDHTYHGYIVRLEPTFDGIFYTTVCVTDMTEESRENATAVILGNIRQNLIFIPSQCLVINHLGQEGVFVVQNGYAVFRKVKTGSLMQEGKVQITEGIFPGETIIVSPRNIRSGDRILPP